MYHNSLISDKITGISESVGNEIWISTDRGVCKWNIKRRNYLHDIYNPILHSAIRIDDYQRGTLIEENVVLRTNTFCGVLVKHENYWIYYFIIELHGIKST